MFKTTRSGILFIAATIVSIFLSCATGETSRNFGEDDSQTDDSYIPFDIVNELEYGREALILFERNSLISGRSRGSRDTTIPYGNVRYHYNFYNEYFEKQEGIYYSGINDNNRFADTTFNPPKGDVVKIYWYPPNEKPIDSVFIFQNKSFMLAGKIIVYEMSEVGTK